MLEYPGVKAIDPAYALPVDLVDRVFYGHAKGVSPQESLPF